MRYFLITFYRKPGGQIDEHVQTSKRVRTSDYSNCNVIIDYATKKVEKCVVEGKKLDKSFDELNEYYKKIYPGMISILEKEAPISLKEKQKTGK